MTATNFSPRCKGQAKTGKPCRAAATSGGLCFFHANPNKASELGRIGGRNKNRIPTELIDPLTKLDNVIAVQGAVEKLISDSTPGNFIPGSRLVWRRS